MSDWLNEVIGEDLITIYEGQDFTEDAAIWLSEKPRAFREPRHRGHGKEQTPLSPVDLVTHTANQRDAAFNPIWTSIVEVFSICAGPSNKLPVITARSMDLPREMCRFL
jgi:hypothetical protein